MKKVFDTTEVEESVDAFLATQAHRLEADGSDAPIARAQHALLKPLTVWRAQESLRGTDPNMILNAVVAMTVSTMMGEIAENTAPGDIPAQFRVANNLLAAIGEELGTLITSGEDPVFAAVGEIVTQQ